MTDISKTIAKLSPEQQELLLRRLGKLQRETPPPQPDRIPRQPRTTNRFPLSFAQQRLWFLDQLEPGSASYNMPQSLRFTGSLDVATLERCYNAIIQRHEALRTLFAVHTPGGEPVQVIVPFEPQPLALVDLSALAPAQREAEVQQRAVAEASRPFDLAAGPLVRATLLRLGRAEHVFLLNMHHIITDGWSLGVLVRELMALYTAGGNPSALPPLPIQYPDYAVWQRQWLAGDVHARQLAYWQAQLRPVGSRSLPVLDLPLDHPRPARQTVHGAIERQTQPLPLAGLTKLSSESGTTLFMTLLAAFYTLLYHYTHQEDVLVGTPIAGRKQGETEGLIGFFVNTLVMRTLLRGDLRFRDLLARVRDGAFQAYAHQDLPFELLVEELGVERDMSLSPLFQVMFILQNAPLPVLKLPQLTLTPIEAETNTAKFDLSLNLYQENEQLLALFEYNTDLFDRATIVRMAGHWQRLLAGILAEPERRLEDFALLEAAERRQLLLDWNATSSDYPRHSAIQTLFEQQVERTPDAPALSFGQTSLSYRELNRQANQLAHYLQSLGVGVEIPVGLFLERSLAQIIALLAILKAGGAYVPLDPTYPRERLAFMLQDAQITLLLTHSELTEALPEGAARAICLDSEQGVIAHMPERNPDCLVGGEHLAYVCYTSGSTGTPKGVSITHRSVVRLVHQPSYVSLTPRERVLQFAPVAFDAATFEIWAPLLNGAEVVIFPPQQPSLEELGRFIQQQRISTLWLTAGLFHQVVDHQLAALAGVRQVLAGGDVLSVAHVQRFLAELPSCQLINGYGPTESTTFTCCHPVPASKPIERSVPIGRPIGQTAVYILDRQMQPVPVGIAGELYIGGDGLAREYLRRPELTAERFLPNPFFLEDRGWRMEDRHPVPSEKPSWFLSPSASRDKEAKIANNLLDADHERSSISHPPSSERLYRTGDLARWLADGTVEFLGRGDGQIKLRGFRVELGEIEAALLRHAALAEACVLLHTNPRSEDKQLIAYVVARPGQAVATAELRSFLHSHLPDYMVPVAFVPLDELPLTPNGKIDRKALPAPEQFERAPELPYVAARTPTEALLVDLWSDLLGISQVGLEDNFFVLGGHSLLATQLIARVRDTFQIDLPLRAIFETLTIAGLAERIDAARQQHLAPPVMPVDRTGPLPLSFAQQRLWFIDQLLPGSTAYNITIAIRLAGMLDHDALAASLNELVRRHESLRTIFPHGGAAQAPVQIIRPAADLALPLMDLSQASAEARTRHMEALLAEEAQRPFDLSRGPLLRAMLVRQQPHEHELLLSMHHIITDGWSMNILVRELATLYRSFSQPEPAPALPVPAIQYGDYAAWQREWFQGDTLDAELDYWRGQLRSSQAGGSLPVLDLPLDHPRPPVQTFSGGSETRLLAPALVEDLKALSRRESVTLFMTLLAAFDLLLYRYSGQTDLLIGTPIAGRVRPELEDIVGLFVNTLVIRANLTPGQSFGDLLAQVRDTTLAAFDHQALPFERLVEDLQPERDLSRTPVFQVMFNMLNFSEVALELPGLQISFSDPPPSAQFDLTLTLLEDPTGLFATFTYNADLFEAATIVRMAGHWQRLLAGILAEPERRLEDFALLDAAERRQLLLEWNATSSDYPRHSAIQTLFEQQVERTPDAPALSFGQTSLSYRELNRQANQLAHYLHSLGVGVETPVGLFLERSLAQIIALLAILKAGGAYVPLDRTYPRERLAFMLQDAQITLLLTHSELTEALPEGMARAICLDSQQDVIEQMPSSNPDCEIGGEHLAYVCYTSGSTGTPKGVSITHRSVVRLVHQPSYVSLTPRERVLQFAPVAFDAATFEIWAPLLNGAEVVIFPPQQPSLEELGRFIQQQRISTLWLTAGLFHQVVDHQLAALAGVRQVLAGGDVLSVAHVQRFLAELPSCQLINGYGPTESTTFTCCHPVPASKPIERSVPIGRPIGQTAVYILDRQMQPVPVGIAGELYIGGDGLAREYLRRPELTAERFLPNPFFLEDRGWRMEDRHPVPSEKPSWFLSPSASRDKEAKIANNLLDADHERSSISHPPSSERLYRTGDLARWLADGTVEFLGRIDGQVKLRGFRVELGEIEAALLRHVALAQACVLLHTNPRSEDKQLLAYVVTKPGQSIASGELRAFLQSHLPDYMVPVAFVPLDALPLTPNGKIDRKALPALEFMQAGMPATYVAPQTPTEIALAAVCAEVLGVDRVGIHDNFFELGGHSLLALQVISRLRQVLGIEVSVSALFTAQTVAALAQHIDVVAWAANSQAAVAQPIGIGEEGDI